MHTRPTADPQRREFLLTVSVVVGLFSGESFQVTVCAGVKSTPKVK